MRRFVIMITLLLTVLVPAWGQADDPGELPLLVDEGTYLGTTFYGTGRVPDDDAVHAIMEEAVAAGMNGFTFYEEWYTLEPRPGEYALDDLEASLVWLESLGIQPILNITIGDTDELSLPFDLMNDARDDVINDLPLDDPLILERLYGLLDVVVPLYVEHGGFYLALGNEMDGWMQDPRLAQSYPRMIAAAVEYAHTLAPDLAVGANTTGYGPLTQSPMWQELRAVADIVSFNIYGLDPEWLTAMPLDDIPDLLDAALAPYGDDPVILHEFGCVSGSAAGSSPEMQAECLGVMLEYIATHPQIRYASVFTLSDFDDDTCDLVMEWFGFEAEDLPDSSYAVIRDFICTLGLRNSDLSAKPAWDVFLEYAAR